MVRTLDIYDRLIHRHYNGLSSRAKSHVSSDVVSTSSDQLLDLKWRKPQLARGDVCKLMLNKVMWVAGSCMSRASRCGTWILVPLIYVGDSTPLLALLLASVDTRATELRLAETLKSKSGWLMSSLSHQEHRETEVSRKEGCNFCGTPMCYLRGSCYTNQ